MEKIRQVRVAGDVSFFKKGLMNRWKLKDYHDIYAPCYFFSLNDDRDIDAVKKHKGFKLVHFVNARGDQFIDKLKSIPDLVIKGNPYLTKTEGHKIKWGVTFEIKDYSMFKPNVLGNKIYCYIGKGRAGERGWDIAEKLQKKINFEIIYGILRSNLKNAGLKPLKENYYNKCFLNLNLEKSGGGGRTTIIELGLMGRKTIMNTKFYYDSVIPYNNMDDIVDIINKESKKVGTVQKPMNPHNTGEEWLNVDFWL